MADTSTEHERLTRSTSAVERHRDDMPQDEYEHLLRLAAEAE